MLCLRGDGSGTTWMPRNVRSSAPIYGLRPSATMRAWGTFRATRGSSSSQCDSTPPITPGMPRMPSTHRSERSPASVPSRGMLPDLLEHAVLPGVAQPCLEHEDRPDGARSVAPAREIVLPARLDCARNRNSLPAASAKDRAGLPPSREGRRGAIRSCGSEKPDFGRSKSSVGKWRPSSCLTIHLPPVSAQLHRHRDARGDLGNPVVEERNPRFEADGHRRAIDFAQDVVGQIGERVAIGHPRRIRSAKPGSSGNAGRGPPAFTTGDSSSAHWSR